MENPFKAGDSVVTNVKGKEVPAVVVQTWQNEVQVRITEGDLLWRTIYTVHAPGRQRLVRPQKTKAAEKPSEKPAHTESEKPASTSRKTSKRGRRLRKSR
jgi:hypothetical protein